MKKLKYNLEWLDSLLDMRIAAAGAIIILVVLFNVSDLEFRTHPRQTSNRYITNAKVVGVVNDGNNFLYDTLQLSNEKGNISLKINKDKSKLLQKDSVVDLEYDKDKFVITSIEYVN